MVEMSRTSGVSSIHSSMRESINSIRGEIRQTTLSKSKDDKRRTFQEQTKEIFEYLLKNEFIMVRKTIMGIKSSDTEIAKIQQELKNEL